MARAMSEIGDKRLRELRNEIDNYGTGSLHEANTLVAAIDELLAARPLLEVVKGAGEALEAGAALSEDYANYEARSDQHDMWQQHAAQLRRIRELVDKT